MGFGVKKSNVSPIAVDFGVGCLRVAQLEMTERPRLSAWAEVRTPEELLDQDGERLNFQAGALKQAIGDAGFRGKRAMCSVSALRTIAQSVQVPRVGTIGTQAVLEQLAKAAGVETYGMITRWHEVAEVTRSGQKCAEIMCMAMGREIVTSHMRALRAARLEPVGIHCEHAAMIRSFDRVTQRASDETLLSLLVDLGYGSTKVAVAEGRELLLAKTIPVGGLALDKELAGLWSCTSDEAHERRMATVEELSAVGDLSQEAPAPPQGESGESGSASMSGGSPLLRAMRMGGTKATAPEQERRIGSAAPGLRGLGEAPAQPQPAHASGDSAMASECVSMLTDEISMFLRYFRALVPGRDIGRAIFVGGQARDIALCRRIARTIRVATHVADPMAWVQRPENEPTLAGPQPGWAVALGLAVSRADL
jgi:Tfp pilus assembly PilM family ATPase